MSARSVQVGRIGCAALTPATSDPAHGGLAAARALEAVGVSHVFTLSGGHIFPIFDGCHQLGIRLIDVRHEQNAAFAAEGWARLSRTVGVCAVTAGPGVTNIMSPLAQARFNRAPVLALAGRAPSFRWGQGSLQEIDHVPFVAPIAEARTVTETGAVAREVLAAAWRAMLPPRGPRFLDFPLDVLFGMAPLELDAETPVAPATEPEQARDPHDDAGSIARLIEASQRPVIVAGSNVWLDHADELLRELAEKAQMPL